MLSSVKQSLREIVHDITGVEIPTDDTDLIETGTLDSLALVSLIMELENSFAVSIDFDDIELESFRSVTSVCDLLIRLQS